MTEPGKRIEIASAHADIGELRGRAGLTPTGEAPRREGTPGRLTLEEILRRQMEGREKLREVPLYFGAVFKDGKNEVHVDRPEIIPTLELSNPDDRDTFILRNIFSFDYLFRNPSSWKVAIDDWIQDGAIANMVEKLDPDEIREFEKKMKAMMAVTASARAMEKSTGVAKNYLATLVGLDPKGEPNLDAQDYWDTFLLHADPEKMIEVLKDPQVKKYYDILMGDAGLSTDPYHEWREFPKPMDRPTDNPDERVQVASSLVFTKEVNEIRTNSRLVEYLRGNARKGGFQKYIEDVLLKADGTDENMEARMAAARVACDAFLVDKWTRWEHTITAPERLKNKPQGTQDLNLQPLEDWGGDPLKSIIYPTFLPRLKKVYQGEYEELILEPIDKALRPQDYFDEILNAKDKYDADPNKFHLMVPSMVTNLKSYSRLSDAIYKVFGSSMAKDLPSWTPDAQREILPMCELLTQVYGGLTVKEKGTGKTIPVGKHIVAGMISRIFKAKAQAITIESARPDASEIISSMIDPEYRERPLLEVIHILFGPKRDGRAGLYYSLGHGRLEIQFRDNMFDVQQTHDEAFKLLDTNDQKGGRYANLVEIGGAVLRVTAAIGEAAGTGGHRK